MSFHVFLELDRSQNSCGKGQFVNINQVVGISNNDTDNIIVEVLDHTKHGVVTERFTLSVAGTEMFRRQTGIQKTQYVVIQAEEAERQRQYDESWQGHQQ